MNKKEKINEDLMLSKHRTLKLRLILVAIASIVIIVIAMVISLIICYN